MFPYPNIVELVHCLPNNFWVIGQDASFEVASCFCFHTKPSSSEICTSNVHFLTIKDKYLKMNSRTKHSFQAVIKNRVLVEVLPEVRPRLLSMNEPHLHTFPNELGDQETAISLLAATIFGRGSVFYFVVQIMTVVILSLAANTAFAGLPLLMAIMAKDGYLPRQLVTRGFRLNYSNGILILLLTSSALVLAFNGSQHHLLPLYASGVFISFLLSQLGMVIHWKNNKGQGWHLKAAVNGFGTIVTGIVLVIIVIMKFATGAWVTLLLIVLLALELWRLEL